MKKYTPEKEEYELLPHKEVEELKEELRRLKEFELTPTKKMEVSILELNKKLDRLLEVFERASHDLRVEEGGLTFKEKMRPLADKMNKILEQNAEIASGILAIADMIKGETPERPSMPELAPPPGMPPKPIAPAPRPIPPPGAPPIPPPAAAKPTMPPPGIRIRTPMPTGAPPAPEKKRTFGL